MRSIAVLNNYYSIFLFDNYLHRLTYPAVLNVAERIVDCRDFKGTPFYGEQETISYGLSLRTAIEKGYENYLGKLS